MIFSLVIYAPSSSQSSRSALKFARAALQGGHEIHRVFFYNNGVYLANNQSISAQDEPNITDEWATLAQAHTLDLVVCITAALRRGLLDDAEADRYDKQAVTIAPPFTVSGLGQLIDASVSADRLVTFG